jgi:hypothetical protein
MLIAPSEGTWTLQTSHPTWLQPVGSPAVTPYALIFPEGSLISPNTWLPTGRRKLMIEPIVMPSLEHCGVPILTDMASQELGRKSRAAMKERIGTTKGLIAESM